MIEDDGDIVKGLGFVTLYASYLEEQIERLVEMLEPVKKYSKGWQISDKIVHARKAVRKLDSEEFEDLLADLSTCLDIFQDRNDVSHSCIYAGLNRPDTLKSSRPEVPDRTIDSKELYQLANEMSDFRSAVYRPMILALPKAINNYLSGSTKQEV